MATATGAPSSGKAERLDLVVVGGGPAGLAEAFWALRDAPDRRRELTDRGVRRHLPVRERRVHERLHLHTREPREGLRGRDALLHRVQGQVRRPRIGVAEPPRGRR
ncbi:MAG: hypothetical protein ACO3UM_13595, partial [Planctomycetota bacterium]